MATALAPLPSFLRASAQDAGNSAMRKAGRSKWSDSDWNASCETLERLIRHHYGRPHDHNQPDYCYIRFEIAEQLEKRGRFSTKSTPEEIHQAIDEAA